MNKPTFEAFAPVLSVSFDLEHGFLTKKLEIVACDWLFVEGQLGEWPLEEDCVEHRSFPRFIFLIVKFSWGISRKIFPAPAISSILTGREGVGRAMFPLQAVSGCKPKPFPKWRLCDDFFLSNVAEIS